MDYSVRYLKRREMFPVKIATVEWSQGKRNRYSLSERSSPVGQKQRQLNTPFFTRKMNQFTKKNEVSQCLKIINMLKKLECEEDLRRLAIVKPLNTNVSHGDGFPARKSWRLKSARGTADNQPEEELSRKSSITGGNRARSAFFR